MRLVLLLSAALLTGCFPFSDEGASPANAGQITQALSECNVENHDFARDRDLGGDFLLIYHRSEPDLERKRACVEQTLARKGAYVTSVYPEDINRNSLY